MNTVAKTKNPDKSLIPKGKLDDVKKLDAILKESRESIQEAEPMTRAFIIAAAMKAIEDAITPAMFGDIKNLMNSPLGFKTDRYDGQTKKVKRDGKWVEEKVAPYTDSTIKRCLIVGLLAGAGLSGNEINIIAGQCYFTKEFMNKVVTSWPGLSNFFMEIGAPVTHGEKSAAMDGRASWKIEGREFAIECFNADGRDMRLIVNAYGTSGVDQLRGLGESKLLRRVVSRLTGLNLDMDEAPAVDGLVESNVKITHDESPEQSQTSELTKALAEATDIKRVDVLQANYTEGLEEAEAEPLIKICQSRRSQIEADEVPS